MKNPNFLILDEPTNDLDILTLQTLEDFLMNFPGCLIVVTHDRYFMDKLVEHLFVFEGDGEIVDFMGSHSTYREKKRIEAEAGSLKQKIKPAPRQELAVPVTSKQQTRKLSFNEKREFEELEKQIKLLEKQKSELTAKLNSGLEGHEELTTIAAELKEVMEKLDNAELRWLELSEIGS